MSFNIELQSGSAVRLKTRGKYCDRDIVVTATGGGGVAEPIIEPLEIIENGIYTASDGVDGYSPVTVNVPEPTLQTKTVTPAKSSQEVEADDGYAGLDKVFVEGIPAKYQDVSGVTTRAANVLYGDFFVDKSGNLVEGTMPDKGAVNATIDGLTTTSYTIPPGKHSGSGMVSLTNDIENALAVI